MLKSRFAPNVSFIRVEPRLFQVMVRKTHRSCLWVKALVLTKISRANRLWELPGDF